MTSIDLHQIFLDYHRKITLYVSRKIGDAAQVEDVVSDIFAKIAENIERYDPEKAALSTWIYTIAYHTVLDYYRTCKGYVELPADSGEKGALPDVLIDASEVDAGILKEEQLVCLAKALEKLSKRERDLIILYYYQNISLKDIAERMGMSYANAKIVHRKAIGKLRLYML